MSGSPLAPSSSAGDHPDGAVRIDHPIAHVLRIQLDRPPVNAIDSIAQRELTEAFRLAEQDLDVRAVILTGAGQHFCAGADLREEQSIEREEVGAFLIGIGALLHTVREHRVPVIAAINGSAHGGGLELALAADLRIGSEHARFGAAGVNVGLIANVRALTRAIGNARARHLLLTGWSCPAEQALDWGLMTELVPASALADRAVEIATRIASRAPLSVEATKDFLNRDGDLDDHAALERQASEFTRLFRTEDHAEALRAFFERRAGQYRRR